jgi:hypothetical protein
MPFQHRILSTARLGVVMVAGMVRPGPQRSMAWWVVIGWFYCWWLLAGERFVGRKRWAREIRLGRPDLDQRCVGKHVSYRLAELLELVCLFRVLLSSPLFFPLLSLHASCLGTLTPSFFPTFVSIATSSNRALFQLLHSLAQRATFHPLPLQGVYSFLLARPNSTSHH